MGSCRRAGTAPAGASCMTGSSTGAARTGNSYGPTGNRRLLCRHVTVNAAWLYGQFVSDDPDPEILSCVYWAEDLELAKARLNPSSATILAAFAQRGKVRRTVGLQVDTYLMAWHCQPDTSIEDRYLAPYLQRRGWVDDHLQRMRWGPRGSPPSREDALPRRGYVEVIVDDYQ